MTTDQTFTGRRVTSRVTDDGQVELTLAEASVDAPGPDEVVVRVEASPINPSDVGLLLAGADPASAAARGTSTVLQLPRGALDGLRPRLDRALPVGNEGAGTVVAAGDRATGLIGRVVSCAGGGMWAQYRRLAAADCLPLDPGTPARVGASAFVNPLTALGLLETARRDGHTAVVHTAAASNLGQMMVRVCRADGIGLVNVVRRPEQVELLRSLGAEHVCDSSADDFSEQLGDAVAATGATAAFDAVGGGPLTGQILAAMEAALTRDAPFSVYGSPVRKQVYVYGRLDTRPLEIGGRIGLGWQVGGWLLTWFLGGLGPDEAGRLRGRVAAELTTTFASDYGTEIPLDGVLDPDTIAAYARRSTGQKYLITP